jgi:peptidylamidoglycolate lyase
MNSLISRRRFLQCCALSAGLSWEHRLEAASTESHAPDMTWPSLSADIYPEPCQMTGVAVASDGTILVLNHGENSVEPLKPFKREIIKKPAVLVLDPKTGKILRTWGTNLFMRPHQISVDTKGNVWIVDSGLKKVFKFDAQGAQLLELGGDEIKFNLPTDMAVLSDGTFIVADGETNKRGIKFNTEGESLGNWGLRGDGPIILHTPHSITSDPEDRVYVADKERHWVQVLNPEGEVLATWKKVGSPLSIRYHAGFIYVLSNLSGTRGIVRRFNPAGELQDSFRTKGLGKIQEYEWPHGLAISDGGDTVYVGFVLTARRVQRYRRLKRS